MRRQVVKRVVIPDRSMLSMCNTYKIKNTSDGDTIHEQVFKIKKSCNCTEIVMQIHELVFLHKPTQTIKNNIK